MFYKKGYFYKKIIRCIFVKIKPKNNEGLDFQNKDFISKALFNQITQIVMACDSY